MNIQLPLVYKEILESPCLNVVLHGGRLGGKSNGTAIVGILTMLQQPYTDGVVLRVSYGSLGDSSYAEMENALLQFDEYAEEFTLKKSPLRIVRKDNSGTIYFLGYGGSNTSRTKSIRTKHKISFVILEETQELKSKRNFDEAMASIRRHFGDHVKVFILGNNPPQEAHWFNVFIEQCKNDADYIVRNVSYLDILPFINDYDLKEIIKTKIIDPEYYDWFYMGKTTGGFGSVYPMFRKEKHIITAQQFDYFKASTTVKIVGCVIGGDGAVNRDATSFVPILLLNNGQSVIGPIFYHNPKDDGVIGYHQLVQDHLQRWFDELCSRFRLTTRQELRMNPNLPKIPIWMRIDSAAPDLIQECKFFLGDRADIRAITKHSIMEMVGVCQSTIANSNMYIIDYGGYYDYVRNSFIKKEVNLLAEQLSMLIWNDKQNGYDPIVPNDVCDAWTYGNFFWYSNIENINYFNILRVNAIQNTLISDILKK